MEVHQMHYRARPFKIASANGKFKGIVAVNLKDLIEKSKHSLNLVTSSENISVFLAEDYTLIDNEEYFATLQDNTKLFIENINIKDEIDVVDAAVNEQSESQEIMNASQKKYLPIVLRRKLNSSNNMVDCITSFLTMSNEELETLVSCDVCDIASELECEKDIADIFIDNASKELLRRQELTEAKHLLTMFERAKKFDATDGIKRKKVSQKD